MKIRHTFEFDDEDREAIAFSLNEKGTAPRADVLEWLLNLVDLEMSNLRQSYLIARDPVEMKEELELTRAGEE